MLYLVTYDLREPERDYQALQDTIQRIGEANHCLGSVWLLHSRMNVNEVQGALLQVMDTNDRLLIADITGRPRNGWLTRDQWEWARVHDF